MLQDGKHLRVPLTEEEPPKADGRRFLHFHTIPLTKLACQALQSWSPVSQRWNRVVLVPVLILFAMNENNAATKRATTPKRNTRDSWDFFRAGTGCSWNYDKFRYYTPTAPFDKSPLTILFFLFLQLWGNHATTSSVPTATKQGLEHKKQICL